jgi:hypothetical protein
LTEADSGQSRNGVGSSKPSPSDCDQARDQSGQPEADPVPHFFVVIVSFLLPLLFQLRDPAACLAFLSRQVLLYLLKVSASPTEFLLNWVRATDRGAISPFGGSELLLSGCHLPSGRRNSIFRIGKLGGEVLRAGCVHSTRQKPDSYDHYYCGRP